MVVAANKMDTPEAQANWETITTDPDYDHLSFVPASAHAEKALKNANEAGVVDYTPARATSISSVMSPASRRRASIRSANSSPSTTGTGVQGARSKPPSSTYSTVSPSSPAPRTGAKTRRGLPRLLYPPRWVDDRGLRVPHPLGYRRGAPPRHRLSERPAGRHRSRALPPRCDRTDLDEAGRAVKSVDAAAGVRYLRRRPDRRRRVGKVREPQSVEQPGRWSPLAVPAAVRVVPIEKVFEGVGIETVVGLFIRFARPVGPRVSASGARRRRGRTPLGG